MLLPDADVERQDRLALGRNGRARLTNITTVNDVFVPRGAHPSSSKIWPRAAIQTPALLAFCPTSQTDRL